MEAQLSFLREIDKLKNVVRKTPLIDQSRRENSAEHSWHLAMYALILGDAAKEDINLDRVIRMLLIHDIVEIDAGDFPIHETGESESQTELEQAAAQRLFGLLPESLSQELKTLWQEFEAGETEDAAFAKSLDRMQPLIHNIATGGGTWVDSHITKEQVYDRYGPTISSGSTILWNKAKELVNDHYA